MIARLRRLFGRKFVQDTLVLQIGKIAVTVLSLLGSVVVYRRMGPELFGVFTLAQSFLTIWGSIDLTGVGTSTNIVLAIAIGARDPQGILDALAFYVKVNLAINVLILLVIALLGAPSAVLLYHQSEPQIVTLALGLAVGAIADGLYALIVIALQSRRSMRVLTGMQIANQVVLSLCLIAAALISPTPESLVIGRLIYSYATLILALIIYARVRDQGDVPYPPLHDLFARAWSVSPRLYWRFGLANAIDKNAAALFTEIPMQLVGIFAGAGAVGYLELAMNGITQAGFLTSGIFQNLEAIVPQAVGRKDYAGLWRNFLRVLIVMALGSLVLFGLLALVAPFVIPPILGARWVPAIPALAVLTIYGAVTSVGGLFGPLYRTLNLMRPIITMKVIVLILIVPISLLLFAPPAAAPAADLSGAGAVTGAWIMNIAFLILIALTAAITLPQLRKHAYEPQTNPS